jgi:hypothetical protein
VIVIRTSCVPTHKLQEPLYSRGIWYQLFAMLLQSAVALLLVGLKPVRASFNFYASYDTAFLVDLYGISEACVAAL